MTRVAEHLISFHRDFHELVYGTETFERAAPPPILGRWRADCSCGQWLDSGWDLTQLEIAADAHTELVAGGGDVLGVSTHILARRLHGRARLVMVAARAAYEHDEQGAERDPVPWVDAANFVRTNYLADAGPVVDALVAHLTGRPAAVADQDGPFYVTVNTDPPKPPYGSPERAEYDENAAVADAMDRLENPERWVTIGHVEGNDDE